MLDLIKNIKNKLNKKVFSKQNQFIYFDGIEKSLDSSNYLDIHNTDYNISIVFNSIEEQENFLNSIRVSKQFIKTIDEFYEKFDINNFEVLKDMALTDNNPEIYKKKLAKLKKINGVVCECKKTKKRILALLIPTLDIEDIFFEDIIYISHDILISFYGIKTIDFLLPANSSKEKNNNKNADIDTILEYLENNNISDLHFFSQRGGFRLTARVDSNVDWELTDNNLIDSEVLNNITNQALDRAGLDIYTNEKEKRGYIQTRFQGQLRTFRIHQINITNNNKLGISVSIRRLPSEQEIINSSFEKLGYSGEFIEIIYKVLGSKGGKTLNGIGIVSGMTNSGKTTLLAKILSYAQRDLKKRIGRILNPMEIPITDTVAIDLKLTAMADTKLKIEYEDAMGQFLSQDLDLVEIGEVRFNDEIRSFGNMGLQGQGLTLTTLHTFGYQGAIRRLIQAGISEDEIKEIFRFSHHQHLLNRVCQKCKGIGEIHTSSKKAEKCNLCLGVKIAGREVIYETIYFFPNRLKSSDNLFDLEKLVKEKKCIYVPLQKSLNDKFERGLITREDYEYFSTNN